MYIRMDMYVLYTAHQVKEVEGRGFEPGVMVLDLKESPNKTREKGGRDPALERIVRDRRPYFYTWKEFIEVKEKMERDPSPEREPPKNHQRKRARSRKGGREGWTRSVNHAWKTITYLSTYLSTKERGGGGGRGERM